MKIIQIIGIILAFSMMPFTAASADDKDKTSGAKKLITAPAVKQENTASSRDDNMEGFLETVVAVLDDDTRTEESADGNDSRNKGQIERNIGLGFAHGMGNVKSNSNNAGNNKGNPENNPHNDACNGNGHGDDRKNNGQGHEQWGNGNGFGHRDCGEPSPAD